MFLVPLTGGRAIPLDKAILLFGRSPECDIVIESSRKVSRKHCCVAQIDDFHVVRDLGSMNGLRVNDQPVEREARLNIGDELWIGDVGYRFQPSNRGNVSTGKPRNGADGNSAGSGKGNPGKKRRPIAIDPDMLSADMPIAIPDEADVNFHVEETGARPLIPEDQIRQVLDEEDE